MGAAGVSLDEEDEKKFLGLDDNEEVDGEEEE